MPSSGSSPRATRFCDFINKFKYVVLVFWAANFAAGIYIYPLFLSKTDSSLIAPSGSASNKATRAFDEAFGGVDDGKVLLILLESTNGISLTNKTDAVDNYNVVESFVTSIQNFAYDRANELQCLSNATSFYTLSEVHLDILASTYTTKDGLAQYIYVLYTCR